MVDYVKPNGKTVAIDPASADLDLQFKAHPITGDLALKYDTDAVRRAVRNILLTNKYERPFKPNFGGNLQSALFELYTSVQINRLKRQLKEQIEIIEPRVTNVSVRFAPVTNSNRLDVTVTYSIINGKRNNQVEFSVSRVR